MNVRFDLFRIEMPHAGKFAVSTHHVGLTVQLTGFGVQLPAHHMLVNAGVSFYIYCIDIRLLTFINAHFKINGVVLNQHFNRFNV
ncbi:hypothetical protein SDC9_192037 [bioreactor metagenome]|uniref:Uncharacterized protein n=1 Tax=bioreactor metagenome TaxID=1076179 RepID=A0A645I142_9ZZZZ